MGAAPRHRRATTRVSVDLRRMSEFLTCRGFTAPQSCEEHAADDREVKKLREFLGGDGGVR